MLHFDWLLKRATRSCLACLLGIASCLPEKKVSLMPQSNSVIIQASLAKATFGLVLFLCVNGPRPSIDQYPSLFMIKLAPRAGKMNQILCCDQLPERAGRSFLARSDHYPAVSLKKNFPESHIINPLLTKFVRSTWLDIDLVLFFEFMDLDSASVHKRAKKGTYPISSHLDLTLSQ